MALIVTLSNVFADLFIVYWNWYPLLVSGRCLLALVGIFLLIYLAQGDLSTLGIRFAPVPNWYYWLKVALGLGFLLMCLLLVALLVAWLLDLPIPVYRIAPNDWANAFYRMCIYSPILEETIYRLILCTPLVVWCGLTRTIVISGVVFAGLHVLYGNPSPENLIAGFLLGWAFLKSESFLLPVILHSLGNVFAFIGQIAMWYWM